MPPMATGYSPKMGGRGFPIISGDGRLFTMGAGTPIIFTDLSGFQVTNGDRDG